MLNYKSVFCNFILNNGGSNSKEVSVLNNKAS